MLIAAPGAAGPGPLALMAVAGLGWGVYSLAGRGSADPLAATAWNFLLSVPLVLPQGLWLVGIIAFCAMIAVLAVESLLSLLLGRAEELDRLLGSRTLEDETEEALEAVAMARESRH